MQRYPRHSRVHRLCYLSHSKEQSLQRPLSNFGHVIQTLSQQFNFDWRFRQALVNTDRVYIAQAENMPKRTRDAEPATSMATIETEKGTEAGPSTSTNGETLLKVPQKRFYRQRAHANVFVDHLLD